MIAILSLLLAVVLSMLVVKVAAVALTLTGMSSETAKFQARSAFTGVGYTTDESEQVVGHPVRRRIAMMLMLFGNAGIVTVVATLIASIGEINKEAAAWYETWYFQVGLIFVGLGLLWMLAASPWINRALTVIIEWALRRWTRLDVRDLAAVFHLQGDFAVAELIVEQGDWFDGNTLVDLRLTHEGVIVLGIERPDGYVGAPRGQTRLRAGDTLVLYGHEERLEDIDRRRRDLEGYTAHVRALKDQAALEAEQEQRDQQMEAEADAGAGEDADATPDEPADATPAEPAPRRERSAR